MKPHEFLEVLDEFGDIAEDDAKSFVLRQAYEMGCSDEISAALVIASIANVFFPNNDAKNSQVVRFDIAEGAQIEFRNVTVHGPGGELVQ